ncbi:MAG: hypothetical protein L6R43_10855 [Planctomycetes bacterium]|nr:hypothetical protein [Planctomycetota bacterium]
MRILVLAAPGGEEARAAAAAAVAAWNRALDIRLRFLDLVIEEAAVALGPPEGVPAEGHPGAAEALRRERPSVALLHGRGPAALAAAVSAGRAGVPLVRTAAGLRDGPDADADRAADRLAAALLAPSGEALAVLAAEGLAAEPFSAEAAVKALIRLRRESEEAPW